MSESLKTPSGLLLDLGSEPWNYRLTDTFSTSLVGIFYTGKHKFTKNVVV